MPVFQYEALSPAGDTVTGELEAPDVASVIARLNEQALLPIDAVEKHIAGSRFRLTWGGADKFPSGGLALFIQQLTRLLNASLPLDRALEILTSLTDDSRSRKIVSRLLEKVRDGSSLAEAMVAQEEAFPPLCISMVRAGEEGGALKAVLARVADFLVRSEAIRQKVVSSLIYPAMLVVVATGSVTLILTLVIPQFETMFADAGDKLPTATKVVLWASQALRAHWRAMLLVIGVAILGSQRLMRLSSVLELRDRVLLRLPLLGSLMTRFEVSRLCRSLAVLLANGVPAARALALAGATVGNRVFVEAIETLAARFKEGEGLAQSLADTGRFPNLAVQLIQIGEETGRLEEMLAQVADIYDHEVERAVERAMALLVPGITIAMGAIVALIMAAVMAAMVSVSDLAS
jgi:general secretion pathway protein F